MSNQRMSKLSKSFERDLISDYTIVSFFFATVTDFFPFDAPLTLDGDVSVASSSI